jgi:hypothetical protein
MVHQPLEVMAVLGYLHQLQDQPFIGLVAVVEA